MLKQQLANRLQDGFILTVTIIHFASRLSVPIYPTPLRRFPPPLFPVFPIQVQYKLGTFHLMAWTTS